MDGRNSLGQSDETDRIGGITGDKVGKEFESCKSVICLIHGAEETENNKSRNRKIYKTNKKKQK